jgi:hypothetical protein
MCVNVCACVCMCVSMWTNLSLSCITDTFGLVTQAVNDLKIAKVVDLEDKMMRNKER